MLEHENLLRLQQKEKSVVIFFLWPLPSTTEGEECSQTSRLPFTEAIWWARPRGFDALIPSQTEWRDTAIHQDRPTETKKFEGEVQP